MQVHYVLAVIHTARHAAVAHPAIFVALTMLVSVALVAAVAVPGYLAHRHRSRQSAR